VIVPVAGSWPLLERIPRRRLRRLRRTGRIASVAGALVIAGLIGVFVERDSPLPHVLTAAAVAAWLLLVAWIVRRRWRRWVRDGLAAEVTTKLDAIRRAAPFN
jgi:sugar phosphate isomerase/epimerase